MRRSHSLLIGALALIVSTPGSATAQFTSTQLGTYVLADALNNLGATVGFDYTNYNGPLVSWTRSPDGHIGDLSSVGIPYGWIRSLNDHGQMVVTPNVNGGSARPDVIVSGSQVQDFSAYFSNYQLFGVNNSGVAFGATYHDGATDLFTYQDSVFNFYSVPNVGNTAMNDSGYLVTGNSYVNTNTGEVSTANLSGFERINLQSINSSGVAVGFAYCSVCGEGGMQLTTGVLYKDGITSALPFQEARDINDFGQIIGQNGQYGPVLYSDGVITNIDGNNVIDGANGNPIAITSVMRINNAGQILGFNGQASVLLTPTGARRDAFAPSTAELARMSANVYDENSAASSDVGSFIPLQALRMNSTSDKELTFAQAYLSKGQNGGADEIVIAIRGSANPLEGVRGDWLLRNGTFVSGEATPEFINSATEIANLISAAHREFPNAHFTLAGHSLAGGLAQVVGDALGIRAIGFDAPGGNGVLNDEQRQLIVDLAHSGTNAPLLSKDNHLENYRLLGDDVSLVGKPFEDNVKNFVYTVKPNSILELFIRKSQALGVPCLIPCHSSEVIADSLASNNITIVGFGGDTVFDSPVFFGATNILKAKKVFTDYIPARKFVLIDPFAAGDIAELNMADSDTDLYQVMFPGFSDEFPAWAFVDGHWSYLGTFPGFTPVDLPAARLFRFGNLPALSDPDGNFLLGLSFDREGTFRGEISVISTAEPAGVPEPSTWLTMVCGFGAIGLLVRGKGQKMWIPKNKKIGARYKLAR